MWWVRPVDGAHMRACLRLRTKAVRADDDALASRARVAVSAVGPALRRPVVRRQPQALRVAQPAAGGQGRPIAGAHGDGAGSRGGGEAGHAGTPTSVAPARPTGLPRSVPLSYSHFGSCDHFGLWRANGRSLRRETVGGAQHARALALGAAGATGGDTSASRSGRSARLDRNAVRAPRALPHEKRTGVASTDDRAHPDQRPIRAARRPCLPLPPAAAAPGAQAAAAADAARRAPAAAPPPPPPSLYHLRP